MREIHLVNLSQREAHMRICATCLMMLQHNDTCGVQMFKTHVTTQRHLCVPWCPNVSHLCVP